MCAPNFSLDQSGWPTDRPQYCHPQSHAASVANKCLDQQVFVQYLKAESLLCYSNREEDIYSYENVGDYDLNSNRLESQGRICSFQAARAVDIAKKHNM